MITGLSGSGKSSLAFDTLYAEGQRRYVESLSAYARQFLDQMERPDVDSIEGLSPSIAIEQKTTTRSPRSTVGTITEIYDYLRVIYQLHRHSPLPQLRPRRLPASPPSRSCRRLTDSRPRGTHHGAGAGGARTKGRIPERNWRKCAKHGFVRARVDGDDGQPLDDPPALNRRRNHTIEIVVDRLLVKPGIGRRLDAIHRHCAEAGAGIGDRCRWWTATEQVYSEN